jgi:tetratricopeptide (TPR) repeat protein
MEVAVSKLDGLTVRFISRSILSITLLVGAAGCADMMTYSQDAQRQGEKLYAEADYANAAGAFNNSIRQNPRNYQAKYYLGNCYVQMGQYQQAIAAYRAARETIGVTFEGKYDTEYREKVLNGLAGAIAKSDQRNVETDAVQRDAEMHQKPEDWHLLARVYEIRGDADSAIDAYNRASLLDPNNFAIQKDFGLYLVKVGQNQRAAAPLRRAYALDNKDEQVAGALRQIGVIPGPSLKDENTLARPAMPRGPIPEVTIPGLQPKDSTGNPTVSAPRD